MANYQLGSSTLWVFVSCDSEPRHAQDIVFAVDVLRKRGVQDHQILAFVDPRDAVPPGTHLIPYGIHNVFPVADLPARLSQVTGHDSVVATVTGHGSPRGPGNGGSLTPSRLCSALREVSGTKICVLVLGQCFAGVFNFLDVREDPQVIVLGATNLNSSLSLPLRINTPVLQADGTPGFDEWSANVYMLQFFQWIRNPVDIDGDGDVNLLDAYKFAGAQSNGLLLQSKVALFNDAHQLAQAHQQLSGAVPPGDLRLRGVATQLRKTLETLYVHQEPWLLNAHRSREVHFTGFPSPSAKAPAP